MSIVGKSPFDKEDLKLTKICPECETAIEFGAKDVMSVPEIFYHRSNDKQVTLSKRRFIVCVKCPRRGCNSPIEVGKGAFQSLPERRYIRPNAWEYGVDVCLDNQIVHIQPDDVTYVAPDQIGIAIQKGRWDIVEWGISLKLTERELAIPKDKFLIPIEMPGCINACAIL